MSEFLRNRTLALALTLGLGATACSTKIEAPSSKPIISECFSLPAISPPYEGDSNATEDPKTWDTGIEVKTDVQEGSQDIEIEGVIAAYSGTNEANWHYSRLMTLDKGDVIALQIGPEKVEFQILFKVRQESFGGSLSCPARPDSTFSEPQTYEEILNRGAVAPDFSIDQISLTLNE